MGPEPSAKGGFAEGTPPSSSAKPPLKGGLRGGAWPSAGLSRRTPSRQGEALTPRLSTIKHSTKAEINSLVEGSYLPGGTVLHDLVCGYAADASLEPEWLVITDGQQLGS